VRLPIPPTSPSQGVNGRQSRRTEAQHRSLHPQLPTSPFAGVEVTRGLGGQLNPCSILPDCPPAFPRAGVKCRSARSVGAQPDTCSTSPALPPAPAQPPSWASVVRDGMGNSSSSLQTQTAADFSNLFIRCMASGFWSSMAFSCAVGCQEATIFCHFLTSFTTAIKPAYRLLALPVL
jgi:hypothetical protein